MGGEGKSTTRPTTRGLVICLFFVSVLVLVGTANCYVSTSARVLSLDHGWSFGKEGGGGMQTTEFVDNITLPHCVANLSWHLWNPTSWEAVYMYKRQFTIPSSWTRDLLGNHLRVFLHFDRVMVIATPSLNGHTLPRHLGGYLPFQYEITDLLVANGINSLAVLVDSRWSYVPPEGNPGGPSTIDYFAPGGITGSVTLRAVPKIFLSDVFAKPMNVLHPSRRTVALQCTIDAATVPAQPVHLRVALHDGASQIAVVSQSVRLKSISAVVVNLTLTDAKLANITLWDIEQPYLYHIVATLSVDQNQIDIGPIQYNYTTRIGFREARFEVEGFFLNGRRLRIFGLNRHELYPYVAMAMPPRVMRRDAEILRHEFNVNMVRCSHYPQSEAFLDACDELGLMVWEETPGWGYLGNSTWKQIVIQNVHDMILRDRNHPSIIIWGVRVNESPNDPPLYNATTKLSRILDGSRPASGSMTSTSPATLKNWHEDVFALDDYKTAPDGTVAISAPLPGLPYMVSEMIGQWSYGPGRSGWNNVYRRAGDLGLQMLQAVYHAQGHNNAAAYANMSGAIAWCGFEYGSAGNSYQSVKYPGVADVFRIPKLGATFYQSQLNPLVRPVIEPSFYWDFGPASPHGPGKQAAIFSNCDYLDVYIGQTLACAAYPDRQRYAHLPYPPFFCDLTVVNTTEMPELRIDGFFRGRFLLSKSFSPDPRHDQFVLHADDAELMGNGADATRLVFRVLDRYGQPRAFAGGNVRFSISGPGVLVGDNPYDLAQSGGAGAVWVKALILHAGERGVVIVKATHSALGTRTVRLTVRGT